MKDDREKMLADLLDRATSVEVCTIDQARGEHRRTWLSADQMAILANAANAANTPSFNDAIEAAVAEFSVPPALFRTKMVGGQIYVTLEELQRIIHAKCADVRALALPAPGGKK